MQRLLRLMGLYQSRAELFKSIQQFRNRTSSRVAKQIILPLLTESPIIRTIVLIDKMLIQCDHNRNAGTYSPFLLR